MTDLDFILFYITKAIFFISPVNLELKKKSTVVKVRDLSTLVRIRLETPEIELI